VEVKIAEGLTAYGDPNLVPLVLQNLLENAWKFTANRPEARIELGVQHVNGGTPAYYVRDNGAGFREESADRLFRPFQRLHSQKDFPGTGIGLATVWWIVRRHGGRVWAEGAVDRGATFYFTLPWKGQSVGRGIDLAGGRLAG
jgi:light-regulated signal transduction histidine kinase (bacteriophytochrome)